jgi:hypothetical protein
MISTRNTCELPEIDTLNRLTQSLAMLDAIIQRDWESRYYSFNSKWDSHEQMASMRNGEGDSWFCVFSDAGVFLKGFDHKAKMSPWNDGPREVWPGVLDHVPEALAQFASEPAFSMEETTFCIWRLRRDPQWHIGPIPFPEGENDPDGSGRLLSILDGQPATYQQWAEEYYERPVSLAAVQHVYAHKMLTQEVIHTLNPETSLSDLAEDIAEISYPSP